MLGRLLLSGTVAVLLVLVGCTEEETSKTEEKIERVAMKIVDPVCGMRIEKKHALTVEHEGETYYFCSQHCKKNFQQQPRKYVKEMKVVDPVCGMQIERMGTTTVKYRGKTYHFCSSHCRDEFQTEPEKFLGELRE